MHCPLCGYKETKVTNKRDSEDGTRRRRECLKCKKRFTTYEKIEIANLRVIKKDGTRELFDPEKIRKGIIKSCEKRPVSLESIDAAVREIESKIAESNKKEIKSHNIGELVMKALKKLDKIAYVRFASVYREFKDISDFKREIKDLK